MLKLLPTIIWRHRKENLKKCSLKNLETRKDLRFFTYPTEKLVDISNYIVLTMDAPELTEKDKYYSLFFIDATWKYAEVMKNQLKKQHKIKWRSLPNIYKTAYPRKQTNCPDPACGLATVEAIYLSYLITKKETKGLLDHYHFKDQFLKLNLLS